MLEMAATKPGPFGSRTLALGRYFGIWREARLVAMAGERLGVPGHVELSAICVHPGERQGLRCPTDPAIGATGARRRRGAVLARAAGQCRRHSPIRAAGLQDAARTRGGMATAALNEAYRHAWRLVWTAFVVGMFGSGIGFFGPAV